MAERLQDAGKEADRKGKKGFFMVKPFDGDSLDDRSTLFYSDPQPASPEKPTEDNTEIIDIPR